MPEITRKTISVWFNTSLTNSTPSLASRTAAVATLQPRARHVCNYCGKRLQSLHHTNAAFGVQSTGVSKTRSKPTKYLFYYTDKPAYKQRQKIRRPNGIGTNVDNRNGVPCAAHAPACARKTSPASRGVIARLRERPARSSTSTVAFADANDRSIRLNR